MAITGWTTANYFSRSGGVVTAAPVTLACWMNTNNSATTGWLMSLGNNGGSGFFGIAIAGAVAGDPIRAQAQTDGGTSGTADSATGFTTGAWYHCGGVFASTTSRTAYINGVAGTTDTTSVTDPTPDFTTIGNLRRNAASSSVPSGTIIAEAGIWNVALSADDMAALAAGASPLMVRPASLVAYYPLWNTTLGGMEPAGAQELTLTGSLSDSDHPRIIMPSDDLQLFVPSAGGGGNRVRRVICSEAA